MNQKLFNRAVEVAIAMKPHKESGRSFHVSFAYKKGKLIKMACNNYNKLHNTNKFPTYTNWKNLPGEYKASLHSEVALATRLGEESWEDYEILNIRVGNLNQPLMACPCFNCLNAVVKPLRPRKMFYSTQFGGYQELDLS